MSENYCKVKGDTILVKDFRKMEYVNEDDIRLLELIIDKIDWEAKDPFHMTLQMMELCDLLNVGLDAPHRAMAALEHLFGVAFFEVREPSGNVHGGMLVPNWNWNKEYTEVYLHLNADLLGAMFKLWPLRTA